MFGRLTRWQRLRRVVEDVLAGCGFYEAYTPTFVADGELRLPEPLSAEAAALRTTLFASLIDAARHNVAVGNTEIALFEIARVYRAAGGGLPDERWHVAGIVEGGFADAKWAVEQLYAALKIEPAYERAAEPFLHPGKSARTAEGWVGELHPSLLDGMWGGVRARPRRARRSGSGGRRVRRREPVPGGAAGPRVRRRRGRAGRCSRGHDARGGGSRAALGLGLRRVPRRADRRRQALARVPRGLRLARADAHRRGGRRRCAGGSSTRSRSGSARFSAPEQSIRRQAS